MAKKTNCVINGKAYFRKWVVINGKRKMIYGESEKEWKQKVDELKKLETLGIIDTNSTLGDAMETWMYGYMLKKYSSKNQMTTYGRYEEVYRIRLKPTSLMGFKVFEIKTPNVQGLFDLLDEQCMGYNARVETRKILRMFFDYAIEEGYIFKNPCNNVIIVGSHEPAEIEIFTKEEWDKFVSVLDGHRNRFMYLLGYATGLREGELWALKHSDMLGDGFVVDSQIRPLRQYDTETKKYIYTHEETTKLKTRTSKRYMPIPDWIKEEYKLHKEVCKEDNIRNGKGELIRNEDYLFFSPNGFLNRSAQVNAEFKLLLMKAGLPPKKFHSLRHTYITNLVQAPNVNFAVVMELSGHSKIETTLRYTHISKDKKHEAVNVVQESKEENDQNKEKTTIKDPKLLKLL